MQVDTAKFNMDVTISTHSLSSDQLTRLKDDFDQLEKASQIPDSQDRGVEMSIAQDQLDLDKTLYTHPNLTQSEIKQLKQDVKSVRNDDSQGDILAFQVDETGFQKDMLAVTYPLTKEEKSQLDAAYKNVVDASHDDPKVAPMEVQKAVMEFQVLEKRIEDNHVKPKVK